MAKEVLVEISARHVHVTDEALEILSVKVISLPLKRTFHSPVSMPVKKRLPL